MYLDRTSIIYLLTLYILYVGGSPVKPRSGNVTGVTPCDFPSLTCEEGTSVRCLDVAEICDDIKQCASGKDETHCDTDSYSIHSTLTSSRKLEEDIVIEGASQESCAKFCSEAKVTCVGFQYNLQTSKCRLLEPGFIKKSDKPSLRSFWVTFQNKKQDGSTLTKLPIISSDESAAGRDEGRAFDGVEGGFDAIIVEVDFDSLPVDERPKRQLSLSDVNPGTCGTRSKDFNPPVVSRHARIVNGVPVPIVAYPWQVSLKLKDGVKDFRQHCGGAIISSRLILTVAHCIDHLRENEYFIMVGEEDTSVTSGKEIIFEVEKHIVHPKYTKANQGYDIALIKLHTFQGKGIPFGDTAQPICLPSSEASYKPGTLCHISGWGQHKHGWNVAQSALLQAAQVPLISSNVCNGEEVYNNALSSDSMICAGYLEGGTDACRGDSGGPLACKIGDQFQLLGLVSWGDGCADINKPGVYTKTFHFMDWIQEQILKL